MCPRWVPVDRCGLLSPRKQACRSPCFPVEALVDLREGLVANHANAGFGLARDGITRAVSTTPGSSRRHVLGLRTRDGHDRAYTARSTTIVPLHLEADVPPTVATAMRGVGTTGGLVGAHQGR